MKRPPCLLGYPDAYIQSEKEDLKGGYWTSKIGGRPIVPEGIPNSFWPKCGNCNRPLALVTQLYTPHSRTGFDRTVYVFACIQRKTEGRESRKGKESADISNSESSPLSVTANCASIHQNAWAVVRVMTRINENAEEMSNATDEEQPKQTTDPFAVPNADDDWGMGGGENDNFGEPSCGGIDFSDLAASLQKRDEQQGQQPSSGKIEPKAASTKTVEAVPCRAIDTSVAFLIDPYYLATDMEPEEGRSKATGMIDDDDDDDEEDEHASNTATSSNAAGAQAQDTSLKAQGQAKARSKENKDGNSEEWQGESYEISLPKALAEDPEFYEYQRTLNRSPEQILRYSPDWPLDSSDAFALSISSKTATPMPRSGSNLVPNCDRCGAARACEFQLLSTLVPQLTMSTSSMDEDADAELLNSTVDLDLGTFTVWSCSAVCIDENAASAHVSYTGEFGYLQHDPDAVFQPTQMMQPRAALDVVEDKDGGLSAKGKVTEHADDDDDEGGAWTTVG
eukprot:Clim_evm30s227 gene=Clim_evmTU30s227